jgi:hypothetical protein
MNWSERLDVELAIQRGRVDPEVVRRLLVEIDTLRDEIEDLESQLVL